LLLLADPAEKAAKIHAALDVLVQTADALNAAGLPCPIVSCGGTGSLPLCAEHAGITEVQAGGVMFMDRFYREKCHVGDFRNALFLVSTVVSRPAPERAIIDAGRKTMNLELALPYVPGRENIRVKHLSAEHGTLDLDPSANELRIGDRLRFIPGYVDLTVVLHNEFLAVRGNRVEAVWPLEARGKLT
jgi:D-serine deaminase-like pyridoxal phosphate-dependent protein